MHSALYHLIRMAIKMASKVGDFFLSSILCHATTRFVTPKSMTMASAGGVNTQPMVASSGL